MQIEEGKYYKTRDGRKIGPAKECVGAWEFPGDWCYIHENDGTYADDERGLDIIAEWPNDRTPEVILSEIDSLMAELRECYK